MPLSIFHYGSALQQIIDHLSLSSFYYGVSKPSSSFHCVGGGLFVPPIISFLRSLHLSVTEGHIVLSLFHITVIPMHCVFCYLRLYPPFPSWSCWLPISCIHLFILSLTHWSRLCFFLLPVSLPPSIHLYLSVSMSLHPSPALHLYVGLCLLYSISVSPRGA